MTTKSKDTAGCIWLMLGVLFFSLKLFGGIDWSWGWVCCPIFLFIGILIGEEE